MSVVSSLSKVYSENERLVRAEGVVTARSSTGERSHDQGRHPGRLGLHRLRADQDPAAPSAASRSWRSPRARRARRWSSELHHSLAGRIDLRCEPFDADRLVARGVQCVFGCLPHGASMTTLPALLERGLRVIDLSADYRLRDPERLCPVVRREPRGPGPPGPGGLRPAGDLRRRDPHGAAGRQPRLLSADRHPRPGAAGRRQATST